MTIVQADPHTAHPVIWLLCQRCTKPFPASHIVTVCIRCLRWHNAQILGEVSGS